MIDSVLVLSLATIFAIFAIMGYLAWYAYRHIRDDSRAALAVAKTSHKRL
ncbi:DUF3149 domain-containing protein [Gilvimarinus sp. DA14]|nr:DUF3149 domain-containing protein [Gilvimarinus sp. DA14]UTF59100.1 DUF3149 domain-containing protein [Gilvimarinus sp. DA14]